MLHTLRFGLFPLGHIVRGDDGYYKWIDFLDNVSDAYFEALDHAERDLIAYAEDKYNFRRY